MSGGAFYRASVRRARGLAPLWVGPRLLRPVLEHRGPEMALDMNFLSDWPDAPAPIITDCTEGSPPLSGSPVQAPAGAPFAGGGDNFAGDGNTARDGMGCEGLAPEGTSGARQAEYAPANASQSHTRSRAKAPAEAVVALMREATEEGVSRLAARRSAAATSEAMDVTAGETAPRSRKRSPSLGPIDLRCAPSAMDQRAMLQRDLAKAKAPPPAPRPGMTTCRCSDGRLVPDTFGRDCIEARCPLRGR